MSENADTLKPLLDRMVEAKQLSAIDADAITRQAAKGEVPFSAQSEDDILRWLAAEYAVAYTALDDVEPDRQLLSLFPARILLKEQLLPLRRTNGTVEVATSRLFATQGLDALKTMTGLKLKPVLAPREAIEREIKTKLAKYRESQKTKQANLEKAQAELRQVLSVRQEANAVLMGLLQ